MRGDSVMHWQIGVDANGLDDVLAKLCDQREKDVALAAGEVVADQRGGGTGRSRDLAGRHGGVAAGTEQLAGVIQDLLAAGVGREPRLGLPAMRRSILHPGTLLT